MTFKKDKLVSINSLLLFIYCAILLSASLFSIKKAEYNWDMLPYMAVILSYDNTDIKTIHELVYATAKEEVPVATYNKLTDPSSKYRTSMMQDASSFQQQLPFYVVKPLYTGMGYLFYKSGASLTTATVWPSVIAYFFIGLLLFYWMRKYSSAGFTFCGSLLIMFWGPLFSAAKLSTPDALSGLLLLLAIFFIAENRSIGWAFIFLLLAVSARIDNIIPAIFFLTAICFSNKWAGKISTGKYLLMCAGICLSCLAISFSASSFGWSLLYYPSFVKQLNTSYTINNTFIFKDYIALVKSQFMTGVYFSMLSLFVFLSLILVWGQPFFNFSRLTIEQTLAIVFALIIITRFILQPLISDRLYIPYYLSVLVFLVKKYSFAANGLQSYKR